MTYEMKNTNVAQSLENMNHHVSTYISDHEAAITGRQNIDQSPIAQRHPNDFPKFIAAMTGGNISEAFAYLRSILATDPILKPSRNPKTRNMITLFDAIQNETGKAYIIAQFMDVIFADKRTVSEVLSGRYEDGRRNNDWETRGVAVAKVYP